MTACIIGWAHTPFGRLENQSVESLVTGAAIAALGDAAIAAADVDDRDHSRCVELMRRTPAPLLMPVPVLTEVGYLLEREKGARAEAEFLRSIRRAR